MWSRLAWSGLLVVALGVSLSAPAATTLATCVPLNVISAAPGLTVEETVDEPCAAEGGLPAFVQTPEITRC